MSMEELTLQAVNQRAYGDPSDVLALEEIPVPAIADDEVLVRVQASSVHPDVWHVVTGQPRVLRLMGSGLRAPNVRVPGTDLAGVVEAVGSAVTRFQPGDAVFGETIRGQQWKNGGAWAEYAAAPEMALALVPEGVSFAAAATVPTAGIIALTNLHQGQLRAGQQVLVNGAAGGVGGLAVQMAKAAGAEVTGVDRGDKLDLVRALGADHAIDYTREDYTQSAERYDLIFDIPGNHPFSASRRALAPEGVYVLIGHDNYGRAGVGFLGGIPRILGLTARGLFTRQLPKANFSMPDKRESMAELAELLAAGKIAPVIDRSYPLAEAAEAIGYLASGQARGRIVIAVTPGT